MENLQTEINKGLKFAELETANKGKLAQFMRTHILDHNYQIVIGVFKAAYTKHGGEIDSPIHSIRSCIDNVTKALVKAKAEQYEFEGALGIRKVDGEYTLVDKGPKENKPVRVEKVCAKFASQFKTEATKKAALIATARAMGIEIKF